MTPIVFLDTETDGVHPGRKVYEVAMIRRDDTGQREVQFFVDIDLSTADPFGLKVGGFYDRHPLGRGLSGLEPMPGAVDFKSQPDRPPVITKGAKSQGVAASRVAQWTHGAHIVGAVPNFDTEVLGNLLRENGLTPAWHYHLVDVETLAVGWLHAQAAPARPFDFPWKSDDLSRMCGVEPPSDDERHTALGDARWAMRLFDAITGGAK